MSDGGNGSEAERLAELRSFAILDTPADEAFDRLAEVAATLCGAPMAVVTLVDEGRQWFKAAVGLDVRETPRSVAFCAHTIRGTGPFVVTDTSADARFATNPLVTGEPFVRAYHGVPLISGSGHALGSLAVIHTEPTELDGLRVEALQVLAEQAMVQLEHHRYRIRLEGLAERLAEDGASIGSAGLLGHLREHSDVERAERRAVQATELLVRRLTAVVEVWEQFSDDLRSLDELYDEIPHRLGDVLGAEATALMLRDGDQLVARSFAGYLTEVPTVPIEGSMSGLALVERRVVRSGDYPADPRFESKVPRPDGSRSFIMAPIEGLQGPIGIVVALDRRPDHFDEADERSLDLMARAVGAVVRRVEAAQQLQREEERFRLVASATTDAIYDWDVQSNRVWWSEKLESLFGHPPTEIPSVGEPWLRLIHPDDRDGVAASGQACFRDRTRSTWTQQYRLRRRDGSYAHVTDRAFLQRDADGLVHRVVGGISDVSEQVDAEARALRSQRLEAVGQLTGGVAHDFNNLLTVILGNADLLVAELADRPELREFAEMTRSAALRGADLSQRLLAFARRQPLEPMTLDVNRLLGQLDPLLRRTLPEDVRLEIVRGAGLWPAFVDQGQLESALLNLCINARDSMPEGGRLTIETANASIDEQYADRHDEVRPGQYVLIAVSDTGTGIDPDEVERVIEPFFTTKAHGVGSGLGLSMVHGFVKQSRGHLKIYSELGEGTTVRLYLPRSDRAAPGGSSAGADEVRARPSTRGSERILLVEDDEMVQRLAAGQLRALGYHVHVASDGAEALDLLRECGPFDLLFTDVIMPGMGGRQLADAAIAVQPGLRILYTSGYTENAIVHHGRLDAGVELLSKPYRPGELGRKVRAVLDTPDPGQP